MTTLDRKQILRAKTELAKRKSKNNFDWFVHHVFSASFDLFVTGEYIHEVSDHIGNNSWTMDVTGRDHFKSTRLYADIMWALFTDDGKGFEAHYFSFSQQLGAYHLKKIKGLIKANPYFANIIDQKPTSESIISYVWHKTDGEMSVTPQGILAFKRGIHCERIYIDDPFKTEEENASIDAAQIKKVNNVFVGEILQMVKSGGILRVAGTPQTPSDFFFQEEIKNIFRQNAEASNSNDYKDAVWITAAVKDWDKKLPLWPEWWPWERLMVRKAAMPEHQWNKEFMAMPVSAANSYLDKDRVAVLCTLEPLEFTHHVELDNEMIVAGFDIGKKVHPSHLAIFKRITHVSYREDVTEELNYSYEEIYSKWMDHWDYLKQVEFLNDAIEMFNISVLRYDDTRGEFQGFGEQGKLSRRMVPIVLNHKNQEAMAAILGSLVDNGGIKFINESRQMNQMLSVNNDLDAVAGPEGHGDSFWSIALALFDPKKREPRIRWL